MSEQRPDPDALLVDINQAGLSRGLQFELFKPAPSELLSIILKNKLSYSYGMNYTEYEVLNVFNLSDSTYYSINKNTLGIFLGIEYRAIKYFSVGLKLNSSIYNFSDEKLQFNHLAYIDFIFRLGRKDVK